MRKYAFWISFATILTTGCGAKVAIDGTPTGGAGGTASSSSGPSGGAGGFGGSQADAGTDAPDCDSGVPCLIWNPAAPGPGCEYKTAPDGYPCGNGKTCQNGVCVAQNGSAR